MTSAARSRVFAEEYAALVALYLAEHPTCSSCDRPTVTAVRVDDRSRQHVIASSTTATGDTDPAALEHLLTACCADHARHHTERAEARR